MNVPRHFAALLLSAGCILVSTNAVAAACSDESQVQNAEPCFTGRDVFLDNDVLLLNKVRNEDRNYTMGISYQSRGRWIVERGLSRPLEWMNSLPGLSSLRPDLGNQSFTGHAFEVGVAAFTPDRLELFEPIPDDRPYASLLFFDIGDQTVSQNGRHAFSTELSLGVLGLDIAKGFQRWLHHQLQDFPGDTPRTPEGWSNQISDGGEPTFRYTARWQEALACKKFGDAQWIAETNLGYHTNLGSGVAVRLGKTASPWWGLKAMPISQSGFRSSAVVVNRENECLPREIGRFEFYGWGGAMARLWAYNALLQGQFRHSEVTVDSDNLKRLVYDYEFGVTAGVRAGRGWHHLTAAYARRSPEFGGPLRRYHSWSGIYYSYTIPLRNSPTD